eukprot:11373200-Ditylum_brightwellii.AAC.1
MTKCTSVAGMGAESSTIQTFVNCLQVKPNTAQKWKKVEGKSHIHCPPGCKCCEHYLHLDDDFVEKIPHIYNNQEGGDNCPWFLWDQPAERSVSTSVSKIQRERQYYAINCLLCWM